VHLVGFERILAMNDPNVILRIDCNADGLPETPSIRHRLWPERIDFKTRCPIGGGLHGGSFFEHGRRLEQCHQKREQGRTDRELTSHGAPPNVKTAFYAESEFRDARDLSLDVMISVAPPNSPVALR
jgi:hypothetical protein